MHNLSEKNKQLIRKRGYVRRVFYLKDYAIDLRTTGINKLYLHRNTLIYRLDKIEKATGLNIRKFSDAITFRLITILSRLVK